MVMGIKGGPIYHLDLFMGILCIAKKVLLMLVSLEAHLEEPLFIIDKKE